MPGTEDSLYTRCPSQSATRSCPGSPAWSRKSLSKNGNRAFVAFVKWSVTFDCSAEEQENCTKSLEEAMPQWLKSLRAVLDK